MDAPEVEQDTNVTIRRLKLPKHSSGILDQAKAFIYFAKNVNRIARTGEYDLIFATSSRLMTATLGAWIAYQKKAKLYLDIRDIFVDTIKDVFPKKVSKVIKPFFSLIEKWTFKRADHINIVSKGFQKYFEARYPKTQLSCFTNGIDPEFIDIEPVIASSTEKPVQVLYAGNIGEGQGLHHIIPPLAKRLAGKFHFKIIGDGGRYTQLKSLTAGLDNVELLAPFSRERLILEYATADILFLHLNDYDAFRKVLPSKLFEYAAVGKPIWAGVSGYAAQFIEEEITNAAIFYPCNVEEAVKSLDALHLEFTSREDFIEKYSRANIMVSMAHHMITML